MSVFTQPVGMAARQARPRTRDYRGQVAAAAALNAGIFLLEAFAGRRAGSLSLQMDGVHNGSDEVALILLCLAVVRPRGISRKLFRSASVLNAFGLVSVSGLLLWQAYERLLHPAFVSGAVPIVVGLGAAAANGGVALLLHAAARRDAALRLAYLHNLGDVLVSLAPVLAGTLVALTGRSLFEPLVAATIALWLIGSTLQVILGSRAELRWPGHHTSIRNTTASGLSS